MTHLPIPQLFVITTCLFFMYPAFGQSNVSLEIKIVREKAANTEGQEEPVVNEKVYVFPHSGNVAPQSTDSKGVVNFSFPMTAYVSVYIGDPRFGRKMARMSGRYNQRTSVYLKGGVFYAAGGNYQELLEFAQDAKHARTGESLPDALRQDLIKLRDELSRDFENEPVKSKQQRHLVVSSLTDALRPIGKIGIMCDYDGQGAIVSGVIAGTPAKEAGIQVGDRIIQVDRYSIDRAFPIPKAFARANEDSVELEIIKPNNHKQRLEVKLK